MQLIKKSILASLLIACGVAAALTLDNSVSAILFAFGLFGVCMLDAYLFTGKVGYIWNKEPLKLLSILILNVIFGYIIGYLLTHQYEQCQQQKFILGVLILDTFSSLSFAA